MESKVMSDKEVTSSPYENQEGLPSLSGNPVELYSHLEVDQVISPGDRRNLDRVAEAIKIDMERGETPLPVPPQEAVPPSETQPVSKPRRTKK